MTNTPKQQPTKVLLMDIETSFKIAGIWDRFNQNISMDQLFQDTYVLCWAAKWLDKKEVMTDALFYHKAAYRADATNDKKILQSMWKLLDEADYVIAHNGAAFDIPTLNSRFIQHGMQPPSPYIIIDTLQIARRKFKFTSNRLDDLGKFLDAGRKKDTGGFTLWSDIVLKKSVSAFRKMVAYNKQDVVLLENVYLKLRAWDHSHPNMNVMSKDAILRCNVCGSKKVRTNGQRITSTQVYTRYRCSDCGHSMRSARAEKRDSPLLRST